MSSKNSNLLKKKTMLGTAMAIACAAVLLRMLPLGDKVPLPMQPTTVYAVSGADLNRDGEVDVEDLQIYSMKKFGTDWHVIDWCLLIEDERAASKVADELIDFIIDYLGCYDPPPPEPNEPPIPPEDPLAVKHQNEYPARLTWGPDDRLYVCDHKVGSIFIYEAQDSAEPNEPATITAIAEIKDIDKPLGIAVDPDGNIYVGSNANDNIEVYNPDGVMVQSIDDGYLKMPNDMAFDDDGNLYVVDSIANAIVVYDPNGNRIRLITDGLLDFPSSVAIGYADDGSGELFVGDRGNFKVKVFDFEGNFLRSFGRRVGNWGGWEGKFIKIQSLAMDNSGQLHVADCYMNRVQIFDPATSGHLNSYGETGSLPGQLRVPLAIAFDSNGRLAVANYGNKRVEIIKIKIITDP